MNCIIIHNDINIVIITHVCDVDYKNTIIIKLLNIFNKLNIDLIKIN